MTEQQEYRVLESRGNVELREYAPCVVADVVVSGSAEQAASAAFRPLFQYISGANVGAEPLAMTAPVIQRPTGEQLAMTAPVIQEPAGTDQWTVSFVLPAVPAETAAAIRWSGRWTDSNIARRNEMVIPVRRPGEGSGG